MTVSFYLHSKKNTDGKQKIYCRYSHESERTRLSVKQLKPIHAKDWSSRKGRPKPSFQYSKLYNRILDQIEQEIMEAGYNLELEKKKATPERVLKRIKRGGRKFWDIWQEFESVKFPTISAGTRKTYTNTKVSLKEFEESRGRIDINEISQSFVDQFRAFLIQSGMKGTSAAVKASAVRTFALYCEKEGILQNVKLQIPMGKSDKPEIFLSLDELRRVERVNVEGKLLEVKKIFLFLCHTGIRYGDALKVRASDIRDGHLHFIVSKTASSQSVFLSKVAREVLEETGMLPQMSRDIFYYNVKKIAKLAGVDTMIKGKPKYSYISAHVARHSFASIMSELGVNQALIADMLGHASQRMTERYTHTRKAAQEEAIKKAFEN